VIVKSTQSPITQPNVRRGQRPSRAGTNGLTIAVCVDTTNLSRMAFDLALLYLKKPDKLLVLHVEDADKSVDKAGRSTEADMVERLYGAECQKLVDVNGNSAEVKIVPKNKSIKEHIFDFTEGELVDIIVMGSAELSKQRKNKLGSVCSSVSRDCYAHACIVKNFNMA